MLILSAARIVGPHPADLRISHDHYVLAFDDLSTGSIRDPGAIRNHLPLHFQSGDIM
jgi:hypothetical protein